MEKQKAKELFEKMIKSFEAKKQQMRIHAQSNGKTVEAIVKQAQKLSPKNTKDCAD